MKKIFLPASSLDGNFIKFFDTSQAFSKEKTVEKCSVLSIHLDLKTQRYNTHFSFPRFLYMPSVFYTFHFTVFFQK